MKYKITYLIQKEIEIVTKLFVDKKRMKEWEPGLFEIEETNGVLFDTGSEGHLLFDFDGKIMKMKVYVESNQLPKEIVIIYQVGQTWNRCLNTFQEIGEQTQWIMDVEFRFSEPQATSIEKFIEQTSIGMQMFKEFVEQKA